MSETERYPIPGGRFRIEDEIKRSRFITTVQEAGSVEFAKAFIAGIREEFPDASHHCWAYLIGRPGESGTVGMSDDGEPHGTAGRPILTVLLHSGFGDIVSVVTRYFGGTKLGKGGLVRAYSGGVQHALQKMDVGYRIDYARLVVRLGYAAVSSFKLLLLNYEAKIDHEEFGQNVVFHVELPSEHANGFKLAVGDLTNGRADVVDEEGD
jgi:uncharacterized YigZ family protein